MNLFGLKVIFLNKNIEPLFGENFDKWNNIYRFFFWILWVFWFCELTIGKNILDIELEDFEERPWWFDRMAIWNV